MNRVPLNRYAIFAVIVCAGATVDLWSKHRVFNDLGYPRLGFPRNQVVFEPGRHVVFDRPERVEGQSEQYLDGWLKFQLHTSFNQGALWGIGQNFTGLFAFASMAAIAGIVVWLFAYSAAHSRWLTVALALITSGAIGNLWDRLGLHGCTNAQNQTILGVRDFLFFKFGNYNYPIFNFADAFLVTGAIMLAVQVVFMPVGDESNAGETDRDNAVQAAA